MPMNQVQVGAPSNVSAGDGTIANQLGGRNAEAIQAELHGKYYTQTYRNKMWSACNFTQLAVPIFATNATPRFAIFNPPGNPFNVIPVRLNITHTATSGVAGSIGYSYISNVPALVGTAAPVSAATTGTIPSGMVGQAYTGQVIFCTSATISGTTPYDLKQLRYANVSLGAPATSSTNFYSLYEDFEGDMIIPPGTLWCLTASTAVAFLSNTTLVAYEAPL